MTNIRLGVVKSAWLNVNCGPGGIIKFDLEIFSPHVQPLDRLDRFPLPSLFVYNSQKNFCHILCCLKIKISLSESIGIMLGSITLDHKNSNISMEFK